MQPQLNEKLRAWWSHRQGLDGGLYGATPAEVREKTVERIAGIRVSDEGQEGMRSFLERRKPKW